MGLSTLIFLLLLGGNGDHPAASEKILRATSSNVLTVPSFNSWGAAQCDANANLYFHASSEIDTPSILKLSRDGSRYDLYVLPASLVSSHPFLDFRVTSSGDIYVLTYSADGVSVFHFERDASTPSETKLQAPEHMTPQHFAVFPSGTILLTGYFDHLAAENTRGKSYVALFEPSGKLRIRVTGPFKDVDLGKVGKDLPQGAALAGDNGFLYLLRSDEIVEITEFGKVARRIPFDQPDSASLADRLDISEGLLSVQLAKANKPGQPLTMMYLLLDISNGSEVGLLRPDEQELGNNLLCFSREAGYTFYNVEKGNVKLVSAKLP